MAAGIPVLTQKGREAVKNLQNSLTARCRSILVQVDGKRSFDDIRAVLKGLDGLEEGIARLQHEGYVSIDRGCSDIVKDLVNTRLGATGSTILRKIDELHAKYGDACWDHLDELNKAARLFYGEVVAGDLTAAIAKILKETRK